MTDIKIIQPDELSTQHFIFEDNLWKLVIPSVSADANNAITIGADGGSFLDTDQLKRYRIIPDTATNKLNLYEYIGSSFDVNTATLLDSVDLSTISIEVDDVAIAGSVLTFTDVQAATQLIFDTALPLYEVLHEKSNSISIAGDGKTTPIEIDLLLDPDSKNLIKVSTAGVNLSSDDIIYVLNQHIEQTLDLNNNTDGGTLDVTIGETTKTIATSRLINSSGVVIGYVLT